MSNRTLQSGAHRVYGLPSVTPEYGGASIHAAAGVVRAGIAHFSQALPQIRRKQALLFGLNEELPMNANCPDSTCGKPLRFLNY
jgi:hypothetical protein